MKSPARRIAPQGQTVAINPENMAASCPASGKKLPKKEEIPLDDINYDDDNDETDGLLDDGEPRASVGKRVWDSFRDIPPKQDSGSQGRVEYIEYSVRILKALAFLVTFVVVLCGGVVAKVGLLLITSQLRPTQTEVCLDAEYMKTSLLVPLEVERVLWTWVLLIVLCLPELGTLLRAARITFFKITEKPSRRVLLVVWFMETCHTIGVAILVFEVLPKLDVIRGAMLTNAVCFVPSVLRLLTRDTAEPYGMLKIAADAAAVFFQFSALVIWPLYEQSAEMAMIAPALFLASCGWWLTYVPNYKMKGRGPVPALMQFLYSVKSGITESNIYWTYLFISVWKIILFFVSMLAIMAVQGYDLVAFFDKSEDAFSIHHFNGPMTKMISRTTLAIYEGETYEFDSSELDWLFVGLVVVFGSYACYVFSKFACKILIQEVGLALPNLLVVPASIGLLVIFDEKQTSNVCFSQYFLPPYMFWNIDLSDSFISDKLAWVWILWLVSQMWVTLHDWFPRLERLARTEKIFVTPMYSAALIDQSICMNRAVDEEPAAPEEGEPETNSEDNVPNVIACATMWHESREEMLEMFKSILRMDLDQCVRKAARDTLRTAAARSNYYNFETHIFFDDVFELESDGADNYVLNGFVRDMMVSLPQAVREVHRSNIIKVSTPEMFPTPYGGRLVYTLPGGTKLNVHLKDKQKIRHRKRWSQCMYMYYLLGYNLMDRDISLDRKEIIAQNTFLLALDGDIDFQPKAVQLLVDLMKKNDNLGAACGRIHPVGSGLMAWYQIFEYAIGHWMQKATEHMIGCVLCSPGCFSLFRGKALMDDNVMRTYTKECDAAIHYVQYDQGEDRWLCTLLLQRGYRVEYSAASDAYTHCPEDFNEFYNQRRRWVPSTMANIIDLLGSYKRTIEVNGNISLPYILYQTMLLGGTILGPGSIFLMLVGAFVAAFDIDNWTAFLWNLVPILVFMGVCLLFNAKFQLLLALLISTVYGLIMMAVLVGILIQIQQDGWLAPSTLFFFIIAGQIIVAAIVHPQEFNCLPSGAIYYVTIPSMYLLLIIYSVCNLNVVSWGTREVAEKKTKEQLEEEKKNAGQNQGKKKDPNAIMAFLESIAPAAGKETGSIDFSFAGLFRCMLCTSPVDFDEKEHLLRIGDSLVSVNKRLDTIERCVDGSSIMPPSRRRTTVSTHGGPNFLNVGEAEFIDDQSVISASNRVDEEPVIERNDLLNPYWIEDKVLRKAKTKYLPTKEVTFWNELIERYLKPIEKNVKKEEKITNDLRDLRDKTVLSFFMLNALYVTVIFLLQLHKDTIYLNWPLGIKSNISFDTSSQEVTVTQTFLQLEPIGLMFVIFFALILLIQFAGMFLHRFETLCHVLSTTSIFNSKESEFSLDHVVESAKKTIQSTHDKTISSDQHIDEGIVSRRKTVQMLSEEFGAKRQSIKLSDVASTFFTGVQANQDEKEAEKADRRKSSIGNKMRNSRRLSSAPRNSMASRRTTMGHTNLGFSSIAEEEKE